MTSKKRWILGVLVVLASLMFVSFGYASTLTINSTTYVLTTSSTADNSKKYFYENTNFSIYYTINGSVNASINCSITFDDGVSDYVSYNSTSAKYFYNRSFAINGTYEYNVSCMINETLNITENSSFYFRYNFAPIINNLTAVYNLTDYETLKLDSGCYDVYNDTINVSIWPSYFYIDNETGNLTPMIFGRIINKTNYYFVPEWYHVNESLYNITINCSDGFSVVNTTFYINVTPRNVSINFSYPSTSTNYINLTRDYVYCKTNDGNKVARFYITYYNTTYSETLFLDNTPYIVTYRNFTSDSHINISCRTINTYGITQGEVNRSFIVKIIPPGIDSVVSTSSYTTVTVNWITNENATTAVHYGINNTFFPYVTTTDFFGTNHTITFDNLTKNKDYYYYVESCNVAWLCTRSYINTVRTRDCRYLWSCGPWGACQDGNVKTRQCNCLCGTSCQGNGTSTSFCQYVAPTIEQKAVETYDNDLYYYETKEGFAFSKKFFDTDDLYLNLSKKSSITQVSVELNKIVGESRLVILDKQTNAGSILPKDNAINYYNIFTSGIEDYFSKMIIVFEVDKKYEDNIAVAALKGSSWTDISFTKVNDSNYNNSDTKGFLFLKVTSNILYTDYVIYRNISTQKIILNDTVSTNKPFTEDGETKKILKSYEEPLNIAIVIFTIIIGLIIIKIVDNYYSMKRHNLNALKRDAFIIIDKENPIKRFFKMMFR